MKKRAHVNAIFDYNPNPSQFLSDADAFFIAVSTAPGNTHVSIPSTIIGAMRGRVRTAQTAETNVATRARGAADARNTQVDAVITDVQNTVMIVETATNNALTVALAKTIVTECGLHTQKPKVGSKPTLSAVIDATNALLIDFNFKAAPKGEHACYQIAESLDNITWEIKKTSPDSKYKYAHGRTTHTKLYLKGRLILSEKKGGEQNWIIPPTPFIYVG